MIVADTDVLIDFLRNEGAARAVARGLEDGAMATTAISRFELLSGSRSARQSEAVRKLLGALPTWTLDVEGADRAAEVRRRLDEKGEGVGMADSLIAGIVIARGGSLMTRNVRHFSRIAELQLASTGA